MYNVGRRCCCVVGGWACLFFRLVSHFIFESLNSLSFFLHAFFFLFLVPNAQKTHHFSFLWETTTAFRARLENLLLLLLLLRVLRVLRTTQDENAFLTFFYGRRRRRRGDEQQPSSCRRGQNDTLAEENRRKSSSTRMNSRLEWNASSSEIISRTFRE